MGIYTETLLEKEKNNRNLRMNADALLRNDTVGCFNGNALEEAELVIRAILKKFNIDAKPVTNFSTIEELLDALLDPESILYEKINLSDSFWKQQSNYILAFLKDGTPFVLYPSVFGYRCYFPSSSKRCHYGKKTEPQPDAYVIYRPMKAGHFSLISFVRQMFRFLSVKDLLWIAFATAMITVLGLVVPRMNHYVLNTLVPMGTAAYPVLLSSALIFISAGIAKGIISIIKSFSLSRIKLRISTQMQTATVSKVLLMPYEYFQNEAVGKQTAQIQNTKELTELILTFIMNNSFSVIFALLYIPQMKRFSGVLVLPALIVLLVQIIVSILFCFLSAKNTAELYEYKQDADNLMYDFFKGMQQIKSSGSQARAYSMITSRYRKVLNTTLQPSIWIQLNETILSLISSLGTLLILIIAASLNVSRADYIAFVSSYTLLSSAVDSLVGMSTSVITIQPLINQMKQLFDYVPKAEEGRRYVRSLQGNISVEDLSFSYNKGQRGCVNHINLHIKRGEKVAFVGESGCGKSTLLKLLLGMLTPGGGSIMYDGVPLSSFNQRSFRKKIATVCQFTKVFPGTIYENIVFNSPNATLEDAWAAAEQAAIADDIRALPLGMETEISEGISGGFSGGQKQRILLARAFAQKASILFLDEATSALDNISQHKVLSSVYEMHSTVIMIAHRLSTVKDCDKIIVFKNGSIVEQGSYEELIVLNSVFADLVRKQQIQEG